MGSPSPARGGRAPVPLEEARASLREGEQGPGFEDGISQTLLAGPCLTLCPGGAPCVHKGGALGDP